MLMVSAIVTQAGAACLPRVAMRKSNDARRRTVHRDSRHAETLPVTTVQHDGQIEALLHVAEKHSAQIAELVRAAEQTRQATENLERQWQAYINTLPRQ